MPNMKNFPPARRSALDTEALMRGGWGGELVSRFLGLAG